VRRSEINGINEFPGSIERNRTEDTVALSL
jgi:hypothetical protein